ncbi:GNAT family N-acetyltransferase [Pseudonocardia sp. MH-G8]|uniref:GNAT family N-acetyltransferase n=1 Tax=Pseudonocardia sp. MH-G8 TaxID=1854588 RepID=UPI000B9FC03F|nr:GNAT family N-acetyltransferase [Pseudonocardia sp. MH-G8]OZM81485.1 GNAT family N-acetyltransferase [Pseudonocardia sp. MH-G8]
MTSPSPRNSTIVRTTTFSPTHCRPRLREDRGPRAVVVRPLDRAGAGAAVDAVFAGLSPRSRYLRFHSPVPRLPATVRQRLVDVDGRRQAAVVATVCGTPVGIARVIGDGDGAADVAVAVVDAWQRRGVGRELLTALAALAEEIGYRELRGSILPENVAMRGLAARVLPWARPWFDGDTVQFAAPIGPAAWTVTHEDLLADLVRR